MSGKWLCPACQGVVRSTRRGGDLDAAIDVHEQTCPAMPKRVTT